MDKTTVVLKTKPKLKNPICLVGLPGIGNIGRISVGYLVNELKAKKFAELYSPHFFPFTLIHENKIHVLRNEFYYYKNPNPKGNDLILLIGDCQSTDTQGHYDVAGTIVKFLKSLGVKKIITIGGFSTGRLVEKPSVFCIPGNDKVLEELKGKGIDYKIKDVTTIVGAAGLIVGLGDIEGIDGFCMLGETSGMPIMADPSGAEAVLEVLQKIINMKFNLTKLKEKVKEMHEFINKLAEIQQEAIEKLQKKKPKELSYIG